MGIYIFHSLHLFTLCLVCVCVHLSGRPAFSGVESEVGAGGGEEQSSDRGSADIGN